MANIPYMSIWVRIVNQYSERKGGRINKMMKAAIIPTTLSLDSVIAHIYLIP